MKTPEPNIEWIQHRPGNYRAAMFDFDGTLSLLREDWPEIMVGMMVERLRETGTSETHEELHALVEHFVMQLNGKPTIHQMERLVQEIAKRGGSPKSAEDYKADYWTVLLERAAGRMKPASPDAPPRESWQVPGCVELLHELQKCGIAVYLVSGSEWAHVCTEAEFLNVAGFFNERIFGPRGDRDGFLKKLVVERILKEEGIDGSQLLGFGDGVVETQDVRAAGGFPIGVASRRERDGILHAEKRQRLIDAGALLIIPDYTHYETWLDSLIPVNAREGK